MSNKKLSFAEAIREGIREEMIKNKEIFLLGEDIRINVWTVTRSLSDEFGQDRVLQMPISENGFCAAAVGASITGMIPIVEISFCDFILVAADAICNQAAKLRYMSGGQFNAQVTFRIAGSGMGSGGGAHHSQSLEALPSHFPGLKIVYPSTVYDAKGLIKSAIRDKDPVLFFEHKLLYSLKQEIPSNEYTISIGEGNIAREGKDITVVSWGHMFNLIVKIAEEFKTKENIEIEIYNPRTLRPFDFKKLKKSIEKTGRLLIVEEDTKFGGVGAEIAATISEEALFSLKAPIKRIASKETPIPAGKYGHSCVTPDFDEIKNGIKELLLY